MMILYFLYYVCLPHYDKVIAEDLRHAVHLVVGRGVPRVALPRLLGALGACMSRGQQ